MKKTNNQIIKDIPHLIELIKQGHKEFAIVLAGGLCYSHKTINYNKKKDIFRVENHIDQSLQKINRSDITYEPFLEKKRISNLGEAIKKKSLIAIID